MLFHDHFLLVPTLIRSSKSEAVFTARDVPEIPEAASSPISLEPHYSVQVLAELWRLDESTIRRMFESAPGVLRLGNERRRSGKREYFTLRIPASVAEREYQRRIVAAAQKRGA